MDLPTSIKLSKENYELKLEKYHKDTQDMEIMFRERRASNDKLKQDMEEAKALYEKLNQKMVDMTKDDTKMGDQRGSIADTLDQNQEVIQIDSSDDEGDKKPPARSTVRIPSRTLPASLRTRNNRGEGRDHRGLTSTGSRRLHSTTSAKRNQPIVERASDSYRSFQDETSVGKTRDELNCNPELVRSLGTSKFSQGAVRAKNGKVYAVVLNDQWNDLAVSRHEPQLWYVGLGEKRKQLATMVSLSKESFPLFHAPVKREKTTNIFYVGHYKVDSMEEFDPPLPDPNKNGKDRQLLLTMKCIKYCQDLADIIAENDD